MKKIYYFNYDYYKAKVRLLIDTSVFTQEHAQAILDFLMLEYDKNGDPIDEIAKEYALDAIWFGAKTNHHLEGIKQYFKETYEGIDLLFFSSFKFNDQDLELNNEYLELEKIELIQE